MYRQIRGWRHDYRNHIQTMKAYAASGDLEAIRRYLDLLDEDLTTVDTVIKTGNPMTDAILNSKISLAKSKEIKVIADAHIPVKLKSSELDLCCIIGNLFDNAIEASMELPVDRRVNRVYMDMRSTQLYLSITNFTAGPKMKKDGKCGVKLFTRAYIFLILISLMTAMSDSMISTLITNYAVELDRSEEHTSELQSQR